MDYDALFQRFYGGPGVFVRQLTIAEVERDFGVSLPEYSPEPIPFGALYSEWAKLKRKIKPQDELQEFLVETPMFRSRCIKHVRDGVVINFLGGRDYPEKPAAAAVKKKSTRKVAGKPRPVKKASKKATKKAKRPKS